jgi:hypothetical protein
MMFGRKTQSLLFASIVSVLCVTGWPVRAETASPQLPLLDMSLFATPLDKSCPGGLDTKYVKVRLVNGSVADKVVYWSTKITRSSGQECASGISPQSGGIYIPANDFKDFTIRVVFISACHGTADVTFTAWMFTTPPKLIEAVVKTLHVDCGGAPREAAGGNKCTVAGGDCAGCYETDSETECEDPPPAGLGGVWEPGSCDFAVDPGCPGCAVPGQCVARNFPVPAVTAWGLAVLTILVLCAATIVLSRRLKAVST